MANRTLKCTFSYADTEYTRMYSLEVDESIDSDEVKTKILALNASLAAGTSGGLNEFFVSDIGDYFVKISEAKMVEVTETPVAIGG